MNIYLGTQGWSYKDWVGPFYPPHTPARDYLQHYARQFDAVELDTTFYGTPTADRVELWDRSTPDRFQFTAKVPRIVTHDRRLIEADDDFLQFLDVMSKLGRKLGPILIQLPPDFTVEERPSLEEFLSTLPDGFKFAAEFRHRSWLSHETFDLLKGHGVAWTIIDLSYMPKRVECTADFAYVRWLGNRRQIERMHEVQIDRSRDLDAWAEQLEDVARRVERVYGFVNNHYSGHSPADVRYLQARLGVQAPTDERNDLQQGTLL